GVADNICVYRKEIHQSAGESTQALQDVAKDPTLPRTKSVRCTQCNHGEAVFYQEVADNNCVYRNEIHHAVGERTQVLQDVAADPTLPRTKSVRCTQCNHGEAVFFQATSRGEEGMTLFFVCCNPSCGHRWRD
uniref:TFIIS-type domain-containing protein n=1 Tax=Chenopodium quinoa TaxID=63459 RepID=A0A803N6P5_CHEQI